MSKPAIIFDLDGTLWDSSETIAPAWNAFAESQGVPRRFTPADCRSYCGKTLPEIAAVIFPDADRQWREAFVEGCCAAENLPLAESGGKLYPDLEAVLTSLRQEYLLAVVSNCGLGYIEAFFAGNHTAHLFDDYENAARTGRSKGENIRLVMERNNVSRAVYVGDTDGDRKAAEQAGIPFIHAAYGFGTVQRCAAAIGALSALPEIAAHVLAEHGSIRGSI